MSLQVGGKKGKGGKGASGDDKLLRTALDAVCREDLSLRIVDDLGTRTFPFQLQIRC
jgi:hypothetical protein